MTEAYYYEEEEADAAETGTNLEKTSDDDLTYFGELGKIRKEQVFQQIDYTKRKAKIVCTLG